MSIIVFLAHFAISNNFFEIYFDFCITLRNSFRFCLWMIFLLYVLTYFAQSSTMRQRRRKRHIFIIIFMHSTIHSILIISLNLIYNVKISIVFFYVSNICVMYSSMRWRLVTRLNNDFDICFVNVLMNFSLFIVFQFFQNLNVNSFRVLKSIIICINRWFDEFFIFLSILHRINRFIISFNVKIKFIIVWNFW